MGTSNYSDEFKRDAVHQITVRGYPVREVSRCLGVSTHSLYKWKKLFADSAPKTSGVDHEAENGRCFASVHASVYNHFNSERSLYSRSKFKINRDAALNEWRGLCAE